MGKYLGKNVHEGARSAVLGQRFLDQVGSAGGGTVPGFIDGISLSATQGQFPTHLASVTLLGLVACPLSGMRRIQSSRYFTTRGLCSSSFLSYKHAGQLLNSPHPESLRRCDRPMPRFNRPISSTYREPHAFSKVRSQYKHNYTPPFGLSAPCQLLKVDSLYPFPGS